IIAVCPQILIVSRLGRQTTRAYPCSRPASLPESQPVFPPASPLPVPDALPVSRPALAVAATLTAAESAPKTAVPDAANRSESPESQDRQTALLLDPMPDLPMPRADARPDRDARHH